MGNREEIYRNLKNCSMRKPVDKGGKTRKEQKESYYGPFFESSLNEMPFARERKNQPHKLPLEKEKSRNEKVKGSSHSYETQHQNGGFDLGRQRSGQKLLGKDLFGDHAIKGQTGECGVSSDKEGGGPDTLSYGKQGGEGAGQLMRAEVREGRGKNPRRRKGFVNPLNPVNVKKDPAIPCFLKQGKTENRRGT